MSAMGGKQTLAIFPPLGDPTNCKKHEDGENDGGKNIVPPQSWVRISIAK